jgi:transcriptional regulator with XRE-family HTH domain
MPTELQQLVRGRRLAREGRGRFLREAAGLSLRELAAAIGVDVATLSRWEHGSSRPRTRAAMRWVEACDAIEHELNGRACAGPAPDAPSVDSATDLHARNEDDLRMLAGGRRQFRRQEECTDGNCTGTV